MGEHDAESVVPIRRRVAYVCGQWRVTYLCSGEPGLAPGLRYGVLVGPLVSDLSSVLWVAVVPDGSVRRTMIRRDSITDIAPLDHGRHKHQPALAGPTGRPVANPRNVGPAPRH